MRNPVRLQPRFPRLLLSAVLGSAALAAAACGGGDSNPTAAPEPTAVPTTAPNPTAVPTATATAVPEPTRTPEPQPTAAPAATATPAPTSTPVPTSTPIPTPTPIASNVFDEYGFTVRLDQDTEFASTGLAVNGWTGDAPDNNQGLMTFTYNGADVVLIWEPAADTVPDSFVSETYQLIQLGRPDSEFTAINEGDLAVDGQAGRFGGFVFADANGDNASGGLIGAWPCPGSGTLMSLTAIGEDATALQIRFDRIVSGFECDA